MTCDQEPTIHHTTLATPPLTPAQQLAYEWLTDPLPGFRGGFTEQVIRTLYSELDHALKTIEELEHKLALPPHLQS